MQEAMEKHSALPIHAGRRLLVYYDYPFGADLVVNLLHGVGTRMSPW